MANPAPQLVKNRSSYTVFLFLQRRNKNNSAKCKRSAYSTKNNEDMYRLSLNWGGRTTFSHLAAARYNFSLLLPDNEQLHWSSWRLSAMFKGQLFVVMEAGEGNTCSLLLSWFPRSSWDLNWRLFSHYLLTLIFRLPPIPTLLHTYHWSTFLEKRAQMFVHL